jgi:uncharacterized membrane protein YiaA
MAANNHHQEKLSVSQFVPSNGIKTIAYVCVVIGVIGFLIGLFRSQEQLWPAYLTAFFYFTSIAIGGLFFSALQSVVSAGWSASVRRIAESMTAFIPVVLIGAVILIFGLKYLYPWADGARMATDLILQKKQAYLNIPFFLIRILGFGGLMLFFTYKIVGNSIKQDQSADDNLTLKTIPWSIAFILIFALGYSIFSVDLLMTLAPYWYSTIWGVYCFSGLIQSFFALMILFTYWVKNSGAVKGYITEEHIHDLAKFLKGFTVFWAYIAFCQFILIWYANIPEETEFFLLRAHSGWLTMSLSLLVFKFIIPFIALLPKWAKRTESHLKLVCILILIMQYVDVYWLIYPNFNDNEIHFGFYEIALFVGFAGIFLMSVTRFFSKNKPVAVNDPRMHEALSHHVTY